MHTTLTLDPPPDIARSIHDRVVQARAEQDNEQWHLLIIEELLRLLRPATRPAPASHSTEQENLS